MDQFSKGYHEHSDSAVARRELDAVSGESGEADCNTAEAGACAVTSALAVPAAGHTLPSEPHLVGSTLVRFSSNVPCSTGRLHWPLLELL